MASESFKLPSGVTTHAFSFGSAARALALMPFAPLLNVFRGRSRAARQAGLLWALAMGIKTGRPLDQVVDALAQGAGRYWKMQLRALAACLNSGASLPQALKACPHVLPREAVTSICVGAECGNLEQAVSDAAMRFTAQLSAPPSGLRGTLAYLGGLLLLVAAIVGFLMFSIVPKFKDIFEDFGVELPTTTLAAIRFTESLASNPLTYLAALLFGAIWIRVNHHAALGLRGILSNWPFVWIGRLCTGFETAHFLRMLRLGVIAGKPLDEVFARIVEHHPDAWIKRRLARVDETLQEGGDCWISLHEAGLLRRSEAAVLLSSEHAGNLAWALDAVAESVERRSEYRLRVLLEGAQPFLMLAVGFVVAYLAAAFFLPLLKLINELA